MPEWLRGFQEFSDRLLKVSRDVRDLHKDPLNKHATTIRGANNAIWAGADADGAAQFGATASGVAPPEMAGRADELLRNIYGNRFHTSGSPATRANADSLISAPEGWHRVVASNMKEEPHGGLWLGDGSLLDLGHPAHSAKSPDEPLPHRTDGMTWGEVPGAYAVKYRALLVGNTRYSRPGTASHEFTHAFDHAVGSPSSGSDFAEVYAQVKPLIEHEVPPHIWTLPDGGKREIFAEGGAWLNQNRRILFGDADHTIQPTFFNSAAAGHHMKEYFQHLESNLQRLMIL
ncbi:hypothetical protein ABZV91_18735 [Nocardia sp. NPDC004568]|uniref:hypothetical protein n=1 Tax=Nocardia sp. NPDC004568 TaxID=3154551 RepID=UPI0033A06A05